MRRRNTLKRSRPAEGWKPAEGAQRIAATSVADIATAAGYALILLALMLVAGDTIEPRRALAWAACAFAATGLATGLGLGPQLPGAAETDLFARQLWWVGTAAATGAGLFTLLRRDEIVAKVLGAALLALPHIFGAPRPAAPESTAPANSPRNSPRRRWRCRRSHGRSPARWSAFSGGISGARRARGVK